MPVCSPPWAPAPELVLVSKAAPTSPSLALTVPVSGQRHPPEAQQVSECERLSICPMPLVDFQHPSGYFWMVLSSFVIAFGGQHSPSSSFHLPAAHPPHYFSRIF